MFVRRLKGLSPLEASSAAPGVSFPLLLRNFSSLHHSPVLFFFISHFLSGYLATSSRHDDPPAGSIISGTEIDVSVVFPFSLINFFSLLLISDSSSLQ
jgi:hypothetical protein